MWILLENGMEVVLGDEYYDSQSEEWQAVDISHIFGKEVNEDVYLPIRRKINTVEELFDSYNSRRRCPECGSSNTHIDGYNCEDCNIHIGGYNCEDCNTTWLPG